MNEITQQRDIKEFADPARFKIKRTARNEDPRATECESTKKKRKREREREREREEKPLNRRVLTGYLNTR